MSTPLPLENLIIHLKNLLNSLTQTSSYSDKLSILNQFLFASPLNDQLATLQKIFSSLSIKEEYVVKSVVAIGQAPIIFNQQTSAYFDTFLLKRLLNQLIEVEEFYQHMGGIIGYHLTVIELIVKQQQPSPFSSKQTTYVHPEGIYLNQNQAIANLAVRWGIENSEKIAMIFPLGGAGDRLNLQDPSTGIALPAACLPFLGRTLLEGLIRDIQAQEYIFSKLTGQSLSTPIAIMTSVEKNNHSHILKIFQEKDWFGKSPDDFYFFTQPLVPVITSEGNWSLTAPLILNLKPCGHGVLWKLAEDQGVFKWLENKKRSYGLIRQINNPLAGTDNALFALIGMGCHAHKIFGFISCERLLNSAEGTNVLIETQTDQGYDYCLTNIEYTDFAQRGIGETPAAPGSSYSIYPTNTNILFAHLPSIRKISANCPIPGQLINMKSKVSYIDAKGHQSQVAGGRLESTMQNIADFIVDHSPHRLTSAQCSELLQTFIIYNTRCKTISSTKNTYTPPDSLVSTPEQACYDLLSNHYQLLQSCQFNLPYWTPIEQFLTKGAACLFLFHPSLGPLYSVINQKIRRGHLAKGAELQLEIAEIDIEDLFLEGSLLIEGYLATGDYSKKSESRCTLKQVSIHNKGIDRSIVHQDWKNDFKRHESVQIYLQEGAEFYAEQILLEGPHIFEVPPFHLLTLKTDEKGQIISQLTSLNQSTWHWIYQFDALNQIQLVKSITA